MRKTKIFTVDYIAKKTNIKRETVEKIIGLLLAQGKLKRIRLECPCDKCIFNKICNIKRRRRTIIEYYQVAEN